MPPIEPIKIPRGFARLLLALTLVALLATASVLHAGETDACRSARARIDRTVDAPAEPTGGEARLAFLRERGVWLLRFEQWKLAEQDFFAVLQKSPQDATARAGAAWAGLKSGRVDAARTRLEELQKEFPDAFAVAAEKDDVRPAALARIASHVWWRQQQGALVADDLAEAGYDFGEFQIDAVLEDAATALENGQLEVAGERLQAALALGASELPATARLRSQLEAARAECARLEPGDAELASMRFLVETRVAQVRRRLREPGAMAAKSSAFAQLRAVVEGLATTKTELPTIHARRRLFATWLALSEATEPAGQESSREYLELAAKLFASTPNEGDAPSAALAAENLARLRAIVPHWPLSEIKTLPSVWPEGELLKLATEITDGVPLTPGDARLAKATELWRTILETFSVDNALDTPADALRLGDHYRIGAALASFERLTVPESDTEKRKEISAHIARLVAMSEVCARYPTAATEENAAEFPRGALHTHFEWQPPHWIAPKAKEAQPIFAHLDALAWAVRPFLTGDEALPGPLPWRLVARAFESEYATYVAAIQVHDRPFLFTLAQLRRKAGDLAGTLDVLPLLEQRDQLGYEIENLQLPTTTNPIYPAEVSAFVRSLRGASPEATAYADLTAWIEEVNRTRRAPPLPDVAPELRAVPAVALQWTWAQIIRGTLVDAREALQPAEANAKASASYGLIAPELLLRALAPQVVPLYERSWRVWKSHEEGYDDAAYQRTVEACTTLMRRLLALKPSTGWQTLKGGDLLEYKLAFAAGDFERAAKTDAGVRGERYGLRATQAETAAFHGLQAYQAGQIPEARGRLIQTEQYEIVRYPGDSSRDDSIEDGEYALMLRALIGYQDLGTYRSKGPDVIRYFEAALKAAKQPGHLVQYRQFENEIRWRVAYFENKEWARKQIARYLRGVIFEKAERNVAFERAHFLPADAVKGMIECAWIDLHEFKDQLTWMMPPPPTSWDGHRVVTDYVKNPRYETANSDRLAAIARRDYEALQNMRSEPEYISVQRELNLSEPPFWGYYREVYRSLKW